MSSRDSGKRLYVGRISPDARKNDVEDHFGKCGKVVDVRLLNGFGFVEFEDTRDAEDAVMELNGRDFMGDRLIVEFAKLPREGDRDRDRGGDRGGFRDRGGYGGDRGGGFGRGGGGRPQKGYRVTISNLADGTSWQDLKDFARGAGTVIYADVSRNNPGEGVVEWISADDFDNAMKTLDGADLNGSRIKLIDNLGGYEYGPGAGVNSSGGGGGYGAPRDGGRDSGYSRDSGRDAPRSRYDDDRGRYDDDRGSSSRREYSRRDDDRRDSRRSPPPRGRSRSRSRSRSPPPRRSDRY